MRIGHGYDVHRLVEGRPLILGGVKVPFEKGLLGHSDADVLAHAVMDAVLGAAAMAIVSIPLNYFLTYPAYVVIYGMPLDTIIGMYQAILPSAGSLLECLVIFNMPWTLAKGLLDAVLCMLIYKPLSPILHGRR